MPVLLPTFSTSDMSSPPPLSFTPALTQHTILACHMPFPADYTIAHILSLTSFLVSLEAHGNFFGASDTSAYSPSLRVLHKRLTEGYLAPSSLPTPFLTPAHVDASTLPNAVRCAAKERPLAHFEDLYYALLARMREMQRRMVDHVVSGFSTLETPVYAGGPTIASLHASLTSYWDVLNDASCGKAMDEAVREARVQCIHDEIVAQVRANCVAPEDAESQILQLRERDVYDAQEGLDWTPEWDAALVNAKLKEKYRGVFEECKSKDRRENKRIKMAQRKKREVSSAQASFDVEPVDQRAESQLVVDTNVDAAIEEKVIEVDQERAVEVGRGEQAWLWQVEQMQHPAFRDGFSVDAQSLSDMEFSCANEELRRSHDVARIEHIDHFEEAYPVQPAQQYRQDHRVEHVEYSDQTRVEQARAISVAVVQQQQQPLTNSTSQHEEQAFRAPNFHFQNLYNQKAHLPEVAVAQQYHQQQDNSHRPSYHDNANFYPQHAYPDRSSYHLELQAQRQRVSSYTSYLRENVGEQTRAMMGYF